MWASGVRAGAPTGSVAGSAISSAVSSAAHAPRAPAPPPPLSAEERAARAEARVAAAEASLAAAVAGFPSEAALTATIEQLNERLRLVTLELGRAQKEAAEREDDLDRLSTEVNILRAEYSAQRVRRGGC